MATSLRESQGAPLTVIENTGSTSRLEHGAQQAGGESSFMRGLRSGAAGLSASKDAYDSVVAEAAGDTQTAAGLRARAQEMQQYAGAVGPEISTLKDVHGISDAASFVGGMAGQGVVTTIPAVAGAVVGRGLLGRAGAALGGYTASFLPEAGEAALNQFNDPVQMQHSAQERLNVARTKGAVNAGLEAVVPAMAVGHAANGLRRAEAKTLRQVAVDTGEGVVKSMGEEGLTEGTQQAVGHAAQNYLNRGRDQSGDTSDILDSIAGGAAGGGPLGLVGATGDVARLAGRSGVKGTEAAADTSVAVPDTANSTLDDTKAALRKTAVADMFRSPDLNLLMAKDDVPVEVASQGVDATANWLATNDENRKAAASRLADEIIADPSSADFARESAQRFKENINDPQAWTEIAQLAQMKQRGAQAAQGVRDAVESAKNWLGERINAAGVKKSETRTAVDFALYDQMSKFLPEGVQASKELYPAFDALKSFAIQNFGATSESGKRREIPAPVLDLFGDQAIPMLQAVTKTLTQGGIIKPNAKAVQQFEQHWTTLKGQNDHEANIVAANLDPRIKSAVHPEDVKRLAQYLARYVRNQGTDSKTQRHKEIEALMDGVPVVGPDGKKLNVPLFGDKKEAVLAELTRSQKAIDEQFMPDQSLENQDNLQETAPTHSYVYGNNKKQTPFDLGHPDETKRAGITNRYNERLSQLRSDAKLHVTELNAKQYADQNNIPHEQMARALTNSAGVPENVDKIVSDPRYRFIRTEPISEKADKVEVTEHEFNTLVADAKASNKFKKAGEATRDTGADGRVFFRKANFDQSQRNAAVDLETGEVPASVPGEIVSISAQDLVELMRGKKKEGAFQGQTADAKGAEDMLAMFNAGMSSLMNSKFVYTQEGRAPFAVKDAEGNLIKGKKALTDMFTLMNVGNGKKITIGDAKEATAAKMPDDKGRAKERKKEDALNAAADSNQSDSLTKTEYIGKSLNDPAERTVLMGESEAIAEKQAQIEANTPRGEFDEFGRELHPKGNGAKPAPLDTSKAKVTKLQPGIAQGVTAKAEGLLPKQSRKGEKTAVATEPAEKVAYVDPITHTPVQEATIRGVIERQNRIRIAYDNANTDKQRDAISGLFSLLEAATQNGNFAEVDRRLKSYEPKVRKSEVAVREQAVTIEQTTTGKPRTKDQQEVADLVHAPSKDDVNFTAKDSKGNAVAWLELSKGADGLYEPKDVTVLPQFRRQGIASQLYAAAEKAGFPIIRSEYRTLLGQLFSPKSSKQFVNDGRVLTDEEKAAVTEYVKKVLGPHMRVEFSEMMHAGEYNEAERLVTLSVYALDPMSVGFHESLHGFMAKLRAVGDKATQRVLQNVADSAPVRRQLERLLAGETAALEQLSDPEERLAYMYQFWAAGKLQLGSESQTLFDKIKAFINRLIGIMSDEGKAEVLMQALHDGELVRASAAARVLEQLEVQEKRLAELKSHIQPIISRANELFSTSEGLLEKSDNPHLQEIAKLFNNTSTTDDKRQGYMQARAQTIARYMNRLQGALANADKADIELALEALQTGKVPAAPAALKIHGEIRKLLDDMHRYFNEAGVKRLDPATGEYRAVNKVKDYFPRVWSLDTLVNKGDEFKADLLRLHPKELQMLADSANEILRREAEADKRKVSDSQLATPESIATTILNRLTNSPSSDIKESEKSLGYTPFMQAVNKRSLNFLDMEHFQKYLTKDMVQIMSSYIAQGVKRAESTRRFGTDGEILQAKMGEAHAFEIAKMGDVEDVSDKAWDKLAPMRRAVMAMEGTLGHDINPTWRRVSSALMVYQNMRVLPLSLFSSLIDPLGVIVRGGEIKDAYNAFKRGIDEVIKGWKGEKSHDDATKLAEYIGTVDAGAFLNSLGQTYSSMYMHGLPKKINDAMFKWNGMEAWNRAMRVQATQAAISFIERHKTDPNEHSERFLKELGLEASDVKIKDGRLLVTTVDGLTTGQAAQMQAAIMRWVDSAILRPNAAQRPTWASDPNYGLFFHLKQFTYSFHKVILTRVAHEAKNGNYDPVMTLAFMYVPMMIAADIAKGILTSFGDVPDWKKGWTVGDYVTHGVQRAGLLGIPQMAVDVSQFGVDTLAGPTVEQAVGALTDPIGTTARKALPWNPLFGQALR